MSSFEQIADTAEQFGERKGFGHVLVGPGVEGLGLVFTECASAEHEDWQLDVSFADLSTDLVATHTREHEVEDHDIEVGVGQFELLQCVGSVAGEVDLVAFLLEVERESFGQGDFVFDNQNSHSATSPGNSTSKAVPGWSSRSWTLMRPLSEWTSVRTM